MYKGGIKYRILVAGIGLTIVFAALLGVIYYMMYMRVDTATLDYLASLQKGKYTFNDVGQDICVESIDDIGYIIKGKYNLNIYYGKRVIEMNKACFKSDKFREALDKVGLKVLTHENEDGEVLYKVTSWGEEIEEFSKVT